MCAREQLRCRAVQHGRPCSAGKWRATRTPTPFRLYANLPAHQLLPPAGYPTPRRAAVASFRVLAAQSSVVRAAEPRAALDLLRSAHLATAQMRGFIFFGTANTLGRHLHAVALSLRPSARDSAAAAAGLYNGSKHGRALVAAAAAPRYFVLDFSHAKGLDATGARVFGVLLRCVLGGL